MADCGRAAFDQHLISISVVAVVVSVKCEPDGFVGDGANLSKDLLGSSRETGIDHEDIVVKNYPAIIGARCRKVALVEINAGSDEIRFAEFHCEGPVGGDIGSAEGLGDVTRLGMNRGQTKQAGAAFEDIAPGDRTHIGVLS